MKRDPDSTNIGGARFWPLTKEQRRAFHHAAKETNDPLEELTGLTLLHAGLRNITFHHMRSGWLETDDDGELRIAVPATEICTGGAGKTGQNNEDGVNLHRRGEPCYDCRESTPKWVKNAKGDENYHDEKWHPKSKARAQNPVPIEAFNEHTAELLEWWFDGNEEIPMKHSAVNNRIENIKDRAGIEREVTAHDLRTTFGTHLARNDFNKDYTARVMGHADTSSVDPYYKFVGADLKEEIEEKLDDNLDDVEL